MRLARGIRPGPEHALRDAGSRMHVRIFNGSCSVLLYLRCRAVANLGLFHSRCRGSMAAGPNGLIKSTNLASRALGI